MSARVGSDGYAPTFRTHAAPAPQAQRTASTRSRDSPQATASAPVNASPAAVVSATFTRYAGTGSERPSRSAYRAPSPPSVRTTRGTSASSASMSPGPGPVMAAASPSL